MHIKTLEDFKSNQYQVLSGILLDNGFNNFLKSLFPVIAFNLKIGTKLSALSVNWVTGASIRLQIKWMIQKQTDPCCQVMLHWIFPPPPFTSAPSARSQEHKLIHLVKSHLFRPWAKTNALHEASLFATSCN